MDFLVSKSGNTESAKVAILSRHVTHKSLGWFTHIEPQTLFTSFCCLRLFVVVYKFLLPEAVCCCLQTCSSSTSNLIEPPQKA